MNFPNEINLPSWRSVVFIVLALISFNILKLLITAIYNLYFHPLCKFPGPKLWIAFPILRSLEMVRGELDYKMKALHDQYGDVMRFNPDDLSFISAQAWKDIYGFGHAELPKHFPTFAGFNGQNIISAKTSDHFRYRRALLPAFTDKSLAQQEPVIAGYVDLLMKRLREVADSGASTNMVRWYNYTTFDLIGDLAYGESFKGLEEGKSNNWLDNISNLLKLMPILALMSVSPTLGRSLQLLAGSKIRNAQKAHLDNSAALAMRRINRTDQKDRGDFMDAMMRAKGQKHELTDAELINNADILITAGSETTSTLLSGVTYWLLSTPEALKRVTNEVRSAFQSEEEITFKEASSRLPYMLAVLHEGLRIFPPIPLILLRQTNPGPPSQIAGYEVPQNTKVGVHQYATFHSASNFHLPSEFHPERWLPEAETNPDSPFYNDNRDCHKPFSFGPRDCIGRNLAYHEMRIIMARLLWNFDLSLDEGMKGWEKQKIYAIWTKPPLMVKVRRREDLKVKD